MVAHIPAVRGSRCLWAEVGLLVGDSTVTSISAGMVSSAPPVFFDNDFFVAIVAGNSQNMLEISVKRILFYYVCSKKIVLTISVGIFIASSGWGGCSTPGLFLLPLLCLLGQHGMAFLFFYEDLSCFLSSLCGDDVALDCRW